MEYKLVIHGDVLEKEASDFVKNHFQNYEEIWKLYIGNKGDQTKALISNYTNDLKRQKFWEHCYTVLESAFLSFNIVKSNVFSNTIKNFSEYEEFNKNFIAFFSHIGKINDNIINAGQVLGIEINETELKNFYSARNISIHGKVIPFFQDEFGLIKFPIFYTSSSTSFGWTVKSKTWDEGCEIPHDYVSDTCENTILALLLIINNILGIFLQNIYDELKVLNAKIVFEYNSENLPQGFSGSSGYGINICTSQLPFSQSRDEK
jgi:hypothetical protein